MIIGFIYTLYPLITTVTIRKDIHLVKPLLQGPLKRFHKKYSLFASVLFDFLFASALSSSLSLTHTLSFLFYLSCLEIDIGFYGRTLQPDKQVSKGSMKINNVLKCVHSCLYDGSYFHLVKIYSGLRNTDWRKCIAEQIVTRQNRMIGACVVVCQCRRCSVRMGLFGVLAEL